MCTYSWIYYNTVFLLLKCILLVPYLSSRKKKGYQKENALFIANIVMVFFLFC